MSDIKQKISEANQKALDFLLNAEPHWVGMKRVIDAVPGMKKNYILHAGPPIAWQDMQPIQRNGIIGGVLHEKLADTAEEAAHMVETGEVKFFAAHDFSCIGAGAGIITPSMAINICKDMNTGKEGYCIPFEGRDGLGVWGLYNDAVEANLQEIENVFAPAVDKVLSEQGSIDIRAIITKSLQMNDEIHTRQTAAGLFLVNEIVPKFLRSGIDHQVIELCINQFTATERWFHPLGMASTMSVLQSLRNIEYCTVVTMNCSNAVQNGIKVSALGDRWFLGKAPRFEGSYFSSKWGPDDAALHIGDSTVTEVIGLGGFAVAAAPSVIRLRGGSYKEAISQSEEMREICIGINHNYPIPLLGFTGPGIGIDIRKVLDTGITPYCHGGIISKEGGQIGAGGARFPMEPYVDAFYAFCDKYGIS